jgi:WD40 repeat protein
MPPTTVNPIPRNPYIVGPALAARGFWGRDDVFRIVQSELEQPDHNAVVLFGQRRIGKTSILRNLQTHLPAHAFATVYFDLMNRARRMLGDVLFEIAATIADELSIDPPAREEFDNHGNGFRDKFLPRAYAAVQGRRLVLLFDEFDVLDIRQEEQLPDESAARSFFPYLRELMANELPLAFVFVVGRKAGELSIEVKSAFKAARYYRISVLDEDSTRTLIKTAERDGTLKFEDAVVERIITLTACHPFFVQLLCQLLFERAYADNPTTAPTLSLTDVESAIPKALEAGENVFEWIWDGLPPAERIIFSAVAAGTDENTVVSEDTLMTILQDSGARILVRELELAPKTLIEWQMLKEADDRSGYQFFVELMRRWVVARKPLRKVKDELDRINPLADTLYQGGNGFYLREDLPRAAEQLKQALAINANHLKARLLLAQVYKAQSKPDDHLRELAEAYRIDEDGCRIPYETALLERAEAQERESQNDQALQLYGRVLEISPKNVTAMERRARVLVTRGEGLLAANDFDSARTAFKEAGAVARLADVDVRERAFTLQKQREQAEAQRQRARQLRFGAMAAAAALVAVLAFVVLPRLPSAATPVVTTASALPIALTPLPPLPTSTTTIITQTVEVFPSLSTVPVGGAGIFAVALSPDGNLMAAGGIDTVISLYDTTDKLSPVLIHTIAEHTDSILSLAFSPDGKRLVSSSADTTVRVWDISNVKEGNYPFQTWLGHTDKVRSVAFNPDGTHVASGSDDKTVRIWEAATGKVLGLLAEHTGTVRSVAFSPNGSLLASGGDDHSIVLWDLNNPNNGAVPVLTTLRAHTNTVYSVAFSPDGKTLISGGNDDAVILWDVSDASNAKLIGSPIHMGGTVHRAAISPDGALLAVCGTESVIQIWNISDPVSPRLSANLREHTNFVWDCAFGLSDRLLVSSSEDGKVKLWRMADPSQTADAGDASYRLLRTFSGYSVAFSPDGKTLAMGSDNGLTLVDVSTLRTITTLLDNTSAVAVSYSPDGAWLAVGGADVLIINAQRFTIRHRLTGHTDLAKALAWNRDGSLLASAGNDKTIRIWNASVGTLLREWPDAHIGTVEQLVFSTADPGTLLASVSGRQNDGAFWEAREGTLITRIEAESETIAYDAKTNVLALGGGGIKLLDPGTEASYFFSDTNKQTMQYIREVAFSPNSDLLAGGWSESQNSGGKVQIWRVNANRTLTYSYTIETNASGIGGLAFSPDGKLLAVASWGNNVQLFELSPEAQQAAPQQQQSP